ITEARDATGELFGEEKLADTLLDCSGRSAEDVVKCLVDAASTFAHGQARDDVAVVALRVPLDAKDDPLGRVADATGVAAADLRLPGYPLGEVQPDLWRQPPEPPRAARIRIGCQPSSVPKARDILRRLLASWRLDSMLESDVELLTSEVVTNAVVHASTDVTVVFRYLGDRMRIEVGDGSRVLPQLRVAAPHDTGGRGLLLLDRLSSSWGTVPTRSGKRVWFELPVPAR
ncbi:MAG: hypothetical protein QOG64_1286, partial [Acidimicrobiaceae bacterium]|nr:hypothetical protein [Acidimicrobiaceae bacterium]